jgi:hypothetical protein
VRKADEIDDVRSDRCLAAEFVPANLPDTKQLPEALFGFGGRVALGASEVALGSVAVHGGGARKDFAIAMYS